LTGRFFLWFVNPSSNIPDSTLPATGH